MKILFEVLERNHYAIVDPVVPAGAEPAKIVHEAGCVDAIRILKFDPQTLQVWDITQEIYPFYQGSFDEASPAWIKEQPDFDDRAAEERRDTREWLNHTRSFSRVA
ncbi:hypothetical protein [Rhizobium arsenicireducens]